MRHFRRKWYENRPKLVFLSPLFFFSFASQIFAELIGLPRKKSSVGEFTESFSTILFSALHWYDINAVPFRLDFDRAVFHACCFWMWASINFAVRFAYSVSFIIPDNCFLLGRCVFAVILAPPTFHSPPYRNRNQINRIPFIFFDSANEIWLTRFRCPFNHEMASHSYIEIWLFVFDSITSNHTGKMKCCRFFPVGLLIDAESRATSEWVSFPNRNPNTWWCVAEPDKCVLRCSA